MWRILPVLLLVASGCGNEYVPAGGPRADTTTDRDPTPVVPTPTPATPTPTAEPTPTVEPTPTAEPSPTPLPEISVRVLGFTGLPLEGFIVASSQDQTLIDVSDPTGIDGRATVAAAPGMLVTAYSPHKISRITTRVESPTEEVVIPTSFTVAGPDPWVDVEIQLENLPPGETATLYAGCGGYSTRADTAGNATLTVSTSVLCEDEDGYASISAVSDDDSGWGWGGAPLIAGEVSIVMVAPTSLEVEATAMNATPSDSWWASTVLRRRGATLVPSAFVNYTSFAALDTSGSATLSVYGSQVADSLVVTFSTQTPVSHVYRIEQSIPASPTEVQIDASVPAPALSNVAFDLETRPTLSWTHGPGSGTAVAAASYWREVPDGPALFWEVLLPADIGAQTLELPPVPAILPEYEWTGMYSNGATNIAIVEADYVNGWSDAWRLFLRPRPRPSIIHYSDEHAGTGWILLRW